MAASCRHNEEYTLLAHICEQGGWNVNAYPRKVRERVCRTRGGYLCPIEGIQCCKGGNTRRGGPLSNMVGEVTGEGGAWV